jgi:hypothetical protein
MATSQLETSAVKPNTIDAVRDRLANLERKKQIIDTTMENLRTQLTDLIAEQTRIDRTKRADDPQTFGDFLLDPSYEQDAEFEPDPLDFLRKDAAIQRQNTVEKGDARLQRIESLIAEETLLIEQGARQINELKAQIQDIDNRYVTFFGTAKKRAALVQQLDKLEDKVAAAPGRLATARRILDETKLANAAANPNTPYDPSLHLHSASALLKRDRSSALLSIDINNNEAQAKVKLQLPQTPDEEDFSTTVTLQLNTQDDIDDFLALIGRHVRAPSGAFDTVGDNIEGDFDIEDDIVPFPVEIVQIDGQERIRIPEAIWDRFGRFID